MRFRELVSVRAAANLLESGASVRQVRAALDGARRLAPEVQTPLAELRLVVHDRRVVVEQDRLRLDPGTGQALLDFAVGDLERETREALLTGMVRPLIPPADAAEVWFQRASEWDGDPERWESAVDAYERVLAPATADQEHVGHSSGSGASSPSAWSAPSSRWARAILAQGLPRSSSR